VNVLLNFGMKLGVDFAMSFHFVLDSKEKRINMNGKTNDQQ
jgi:hypothetical protein